MSRYLDIIRTHRRAVQYLLPGTAAPLAEPSRENVAGRGGYAEASGKGQGERWAPRVEEVLAEVGRPGSGPAKALGTYLEKPNAERLRWLTKAVLRSWGLETDGWERYVPVVEVAATEVDKFTCDRKEA